MFSTKRLRKKAQSVDIPSEGYSSPLLRDVQKSQRNNLISPVARTITPGELEKNESNFQRIRSPRRGELQRGYTIAIPDRCDSPPARLVYFKDTYAEDLMGTTKPPAHSTDAGQKKDGRRMSFQRPKGTIEYYVESRDTLNSIALKFDATPNELVQLNKLFSRAVVPGQVLYVPDPEYVSNVDSSRSPSPTSPVCPSSSESDLEKIITDSDGAPQREVTTTPAHFPPRPIRVVSSTSEEEEALTEKFLKINCKYITDGKGVVNGVLLVTPNDIMFDPHKTDPLVQQHGCEEYGIMCPLEEVVSAAMCKEITDRKIRESVPADLERFLSAHELCHLKRVPRSSGDEGEPRARDTGNDSSSTAPRSTEGSFSEDVFSESELSPIREELGSSDELQRDKSSDASSESVLNVSQPEDQKQKPGLQNEGLTSGTKASEVTSSSSKDTEQEVGGHKDGKEQSQGLEPEVDPTKTTEKQGVAEGRTAAREKRRHRSHKFLCLRVGKPMRKTFLSNASATMQQYAQRDRKHEYWFAVPHERSEHLYMFFVQWSPDMYRDGSSGQVREPAFTVVKRNQESDGLDEQVAADITGKDWEHQDMFSSKRPKEGKQLTPKYTYAVVVSVGEYQRRIDALNSQDLRSLCRRLQITTREDADSRRGTSLKLDPELDTLKPTLSEPSDLLQLGQIEKLAKNLPPRTIGYPWTLAFSTSKHGMSIKTLYRTMQAQDSPVLLVIKDSDGQVFGALASEPFKVSDGFYGTGETFLFTFCPDFEVFRWTGDNMFFMKGDMDSLAFGGGGGEFGLWLDGDLYHGRSHSCKTFGNPMLSKKEDFFVQDIEIWSFE